MTDKNTTLIPEQGWHCLHLFYQIEHGQWNLLDRDDQNAAKTNLTKLVQEVRATESTQLLTLSVVTPKADLGFMLITPDLQNANRIEKQLSLSLGADVLTAGLQLFVANGGKRIHHDGRRVHRDPGCGNRRAIPRNSKRH